MTITANDVRSTLKILGRSRAEIAERLESKGVTGVIGSTDSCPIANYLANEYPDYIAKVDRDEVVLEHGSGDEEERVLFVPTRQVSSFISWFDQKMYPKLIERE